jgi:hypothetical protein
MEREPHRTFIWSLKIRNGADNSEVLAERYYHHQSFVLADGDQELHPTFKEQASLAPGAYSALVRLYFLDASQKLPNFENGEKFSGDVRFLSSRAEIVVSD